MDLSITLGRLALPNPVLVASGTFGYAREMAEVLDLGRLGGIIPKTVTRQPRAGNPPPIVLLAGAIPAEAELWDPESAITGSRSTHRLTFECNPSDAPDAAGMPVRDSASIART